MLLNLSNHPSTSWSMKQRTAAERLYGTVEDLPFPPIDPEWASEEVAKLADEYATECLEKLSKDSVNEDNAVHIMGELTFCNALVNRLKEKGITCLASTTTCNSIDLPEGNFSICKIQTLLA